MARLLEHAPCRMWFRVVRRRRCPSWANRIALLAPSTCGEWQPGVEGASRDTGRYAMLAHSLRSLVARGTLRPSTVGAGNAADAACAPPRSLETPSTPDCSASRDCALLEIRRAVA